MTLDIQLTPTNLTQLLKSITKTLKRGWSKLFNGTKTIQTDPVARLSSVQKKTLYVIVHGGYKGEFFVLMERADNSYIFLSLPDLQIRAVSDDDMKYALDNSIIQEIEILPDDVYTVCRAQYRKNKEKHK